jgi:hypothetical protein
MKYDFGGWATRNDLRCSDNRVIKRDAFKECDGKVVPLVWNHQHNDPDNVLGHAMLENRDTGVYAWCSLNETESGQAAKQLIEHHDVSALSIYANQIQQQGNAVVHGTIREVSLVLAGANPGAYITDVVQHSDDSDDYGAQMYFLDDNSVDICHADNSSNNSPASDSSNSSSNTDKSSVDKTFQDVINTMTPEQQKVMYALIYAAANGDFDDAFKDSDESDDANDSTKETDDMKHNIFDTDEQNAANGTDNVIEHSEVLAAIKDAKRYGSMKDSFIEHGIEDISYIQHDAQNYGMTPVDYLFPDAKNVTPTPTFVKRNTDWVDGVINGVHHTPFSRIKSVFADITEDDARARGYIKGKLKKEEVFTLLKRVTTPTTIYKKQKMDRDDVIDITDFDVIAWLKSEMRVMLNEEIARAILVGDGRMSSSDDKINETNIRPVWTDEELYTIHTSIDGATNKTDDAIAKAFIRAAIKARVDYKGSGNPVLYTTEDMLTDLLLLTDNDGRDLFDSVDKLATKLRVSEIVTVPVMESLKRNGTGNDAASKYDLLGLILNLNDYTVGADAGGAINMFDDFDIDYNQQKYLIETRCSGALTVPKSAIALELKEASA